MLIWPSTAHRVRNIFFTRQRFDTLPPLGPLSRLVADFSQFLSSRLTFSAMNMKPSRDAAGDPRHPDDIRPVMATCPLTFYPQANFPTVIGQFDNLVGIPGPVPKTVSSIPMAVSYSVPGPHTQPAVACGPDPLHNPYFSCLRPVYPAAYVPGTAIKAFPTTQAPAAVPGYPAAPIQLEIPVSVNRHPVNYVQTTPEQIMYAQTQQAALNRAAYSDPGLYTVGRPVLKSADPIYAGVGSFNGFVPPPAVALSAVPNNVHGTKKALSPPIDAPNTGVRMRRRTPARNTSSSQDLVVDVKVVGRSSRSVDRRFTCRTCGKSYTRKNNLIAHKQSARASQKMYHCEKCDRYFKRKFDFTRHNTEQHTSREKRFVCSGKLPDGKVWGCGRRFFRKDQLKSHLRAARAGATCLKSVPIGATVEVHGILVQKSAKMPAFGDSLGLLMRPG